MKVFFFILIVFFGSVCSEISDNKELGLAISQVVGEMFELEFSTVDILTYGSSLSHFKEIVNAVFRSQIYPNKLFRLLNIENLDKCTIGTNYSSVLLVDSSKSMEHIFEGCQEIFSTTAHAILLYTEENAESNEFFSGLQLRYLMRKNGVLELKKICF